MLRNIALALSVSADSLVFDTDERGPDEELALAVEAAQHLDPDDKAHLRAVIEGILLRHQARTITQAS